MKEEWKSYHEPTRKEIKRHKIELQKEYEVGLECCMSCDHFKCLPFAAEAGFCEVAECNCLCKNPKAMIDIWDKKCDKWIISSDYLTPEEYELTILKI